MTTATSHEIIAALPSFSRRACTYAAAISMLGLAACGGERLNPYEQVVQIGSTDATVEVVLLPFTIRIRDKAGRLVLESLPGGDDDPYGAPAATVDTPEYQSQLIPGWDGYIAHEAPWAHGRAAVAREVTDGSGSFVLDAGPTSLELLVTVDGGRVRLHLEAKPGREGAGATPNKTTMSFALPADEHFFGMGERYASVDHRGLSLYSWAEEGALGRGENTPPGPMNPYPNGPSMTYFPVSFFLSSAGYGLHLATTYRTELHFGSERQDGWRAAVNAPAFDATIYVHDDPLTTLGDYAADTGRPVMPAPWVFGPRRRVDVNATVNGVPEWQLMRERDVPITGIDDAVHFLPALAQKGREDVLATWTQTLHEAGYKAMAYNNPYVATEGAEEDYAYGLAHGFFVKLPSGEPALTNFISGKLLTLATIDLTNPEAFTWFQDLLRRTLALGYDGWMHDFGEYIPRDAVMSDGRRGDEVHNEFPVLSAKAAHDLLEAERPGDYLFFVRSGSSGTQRYVPAVWGGDAEATFDETQGLPSAVRGGVNLSMSGVPYWGSDMTGFKCITPYPNDKEVFLRWVELGAVSPIMMEQNACSNPLEHKTKWTLWSDAETTEIYAKYARLHTRLLPYFLVLAHRAHTRGVPLTLHPFLMAPHDPNAWAVDDAFFLGPALYAWPVVRRGQTQKKGWLPSGRYVDLDDYRVYEGGGDATITAPLGKLPILLVSEQIVPMLDPSIDTLAPATDPSVVTLETVKDRLDVVVALGKGARSALTLVDGTELEAERGESASPPSTLTEVDPTAIAACASCWVATQEGDVARLRANTDGSGDSDLVVDDVKLTVRHGPARRIRWDVLRLP